MISILCLVLAQSAIEPPSLVLSDGTRKVVRSFDIGTSSQLERLKKSPVDLILIRLNSWPTNLKDVADSLRNGSSGRRIVLVDFPALGANPNNALLWQKDWDANLDGKVDPIAPTWLKDRNQEGFYPLATEISALRNRFLGANGLVAKLTKAGFDGMVVSTVAGPGRRPGLDSRFIADIMFEGRSRRQSFLALMRNPGAMMDFPIVKGYFDGFLADGLFYGKEAAGSPSSPAFIEDSIQRLGGAAKRGRAVLCIAYTSSSSQIAENQKLAREQGFIPLALPERLD